ncbi:Thyroid receptor-interacting protein 13-like protein, partial [Leptotrombidium deliense]
LLYGPPGTGKTSLCKALAQTLSIRLKSRFNSAKLIEVNSHSLFSRWFSESGKLIMKLFNEIREYVSNSENLVFVLIDEVESLVHTRQMLMSGNDPSDAMRVVNAVLTEIDKIKNYTNVVILTTSNITGAIDLAFVDRADIKQYIGSPNEATIYEIYRSCLNELVKRNIVSFSETILPYTQLKLVSSFCGDNAFTCSKLLLTVAAESQSLSGRVLRKLPFLAIAYYAVEIIPINVSQFIEMLRKTVKLHFEQLTSFTSSPH